MSRKKAGGSGLARGEGSIYEKENGTFLARWYVGKDLHSRVFASHEEARAHLIASAALKQRGTYVAPSKLTVEDLVRDYLERGRQRWSTNTSATYRQRATVHIYPHIGNQLATRLETAEVQWWVDRLHRTGSMPETIAGAVCVLSGAYREAVRLRIVPVNVVSGVRRPLIERKVHTVWTLEHIQRVLAYVRMDERWHALYRLMLTTGMRPGELRALQWADIDLVREEVTVARTITKDEQGREMVGTRTKTRSARVVAIPPMCAQALRVWQLRQTPDKRGFVFTGEEGQPLGHTTWTKYHARMVKAINAGLAREEQVPRITLHELRHSSATLELAAGTPVKIVSERLGHKRTETTSNVYQHVDTALQRTAAHALEERMEKRSGT